MKQRFDKVELVYLFVVAISLTLTIGVSFLNGIYSDTLYFICFITAICSTLLLRTHHNNRLKKIK
jgi:uncharacterized membrane protein YesL